MSKRLIIVRHGNTFLPGQTPTRVGAHTDLELVEEDRARAVGRYLSKHNIIPDKIYAAPLKRTMGTAELIIDEMGLGLVAIPEKAFIEIDYGPDENKTEDDVKLRLGMEAFKGKGSVENTPNTEIMKYGEAIIEQWNSKAIVPPGWIVDVDGIVKAWHDFAQKIENDQTVLICTSNGIIRFAPHILAQDYEEFCHENDIKVVTGSVSIFEMKDDEWESVEWNLKPYKTY